MRTLRQAFSVARKDLAVEVRTKESVNAAGAFAISILLLFSFAFDPASDTLRQISGGLLWLVFAFAGALVFNRGFARELPNECLDALLASPLSSASLLIGKAVANLVMLLVLEFMSLVVFGIFYNIQWTLRPGQAGVGVCPRNLGCFGCGRGVRRTYGQLAFTRIDAACNRLSIADSAADCGDRVNERSALQSAN